MITETCILYNINLTGEQTGAIEVKGWGHMGSGNEGTEIPISCLPGKLSFW